MPTVVRRMNLGRAPKLDWSPSRGEVREGDSRGAQGASRAAGRREGAAMPVGQNDERGMSGGTRRLACTVEGSAMGREGGGAATRGGDR